MALWRGGIKRFMERQKSDEMEATILLLIAIISRYVHLEPGCHMVESGSRAEPVPGEKPAEDAMQVLALTR